MNGYGHENGDDNPENGINVAEEDLRPPAEALEESEESSVEEDEPLDDEGNLEECRFNPPLYIQRYEKALGFLLQDRWVRVMNRVVDLGCAECKFLRRLKQLPYVRELIGVDADEYLLEDCRRRTEPLFVEYLEQRPFTPVDMYLMAGNAVDRDPRLKDVDAVTAIELIEHLQDEVLAQFPETVFSFLRPKIFVVTTPNREFNVRFEANGQQFRHWDHKFEWTRDEFENWCMAITEKFDEYKVSFFGVGSPPEDGRDTGHCSQGAIFLRKEFEVQANNGEFQYEVDLETIKLMSSFQESSTYPYKIVVHHFFPFQRDDRTLEEKVLCESNYYLRDIYRRSEECALRESLLISLEFLLTLDRLAKLEISVDQLSSMLQEAGYQLGLDEDGKMAVVAEYDPLEDEPSSSEAEDEPDEENHQPEQFAGAVEDESWE